MARLRFLWLLTIVKMVSIAVIALSILSIIWAVGPWIETRYFPVVEKLQIKNLIVTGTDEVSFDAAFVKVRNCEYLGLGWYLDTGDSDQRVPIVLNRSHSTTQDDTPSRPPGYTFTGPWVLSLSEDALMHHSHAVLFHRCHPFWVTQTDFYP